MIIMKHGLKYLLSNYNRAGLNKLVFFLTFCLLSHILGWYGDENMLEFSKYHGCGNDFILIEETSYDLSVLAQKMCHRTTGIGADGLLVIQRKPCRMRIFNSDGSEASMCGNGLRCMLCYCIDHGMSKDELKEVDTKAGMMKIIDIHEKPFSCIIDLGKPCLKSKDMAIDSETETFFHQKLFVADQLLEVSSVFIGAIHTVLYRDTLTYAQTKRIGSEICHHPIFKYQTNVDFVKVIDKHLLEIMTYERGVGVTQACGTGACASAYMAVLDGKCESPVTVRLPYGDLIIEINDTILMHGSAVKIAEGMWQEY